jgi:hypothetical protein
MSTTLPDERSAAACGMFKALITVVDGFGLTLPAECLRTKMVTEWMPSYAGQIRGVL